jgi:hypothetical protein
MIQGFLFGLLFITFTIGISYVVGEIIDKKDGKK